MYCRWQISTNLNIITASDQHLCHTPIPIATNQQFIIRRNDELAGLAAPSYFGVADGREGQRSIHHRRGHHLPRGGSSDHSQPQPEAPEVHQTS
jgi:hypothetical protein